MTSPQPTADDDAQAVPVTPAPPAATPAAAATPATPATPATRAAPATVAAPAGGATAHRSANLVAGPGGVMTDEVGVVTGELTLRSEYADGHVTLRVQYQDADEWYAVTGGRVPLHDPADVDAVHAIALALLHRPEG